MIGEDRPLFLFNQHHASTMDYEPESSSTRQQQPQPAEPPPTTTTTTKPILMELPLPLRASELQPPGAEKKLYWDRSHYASPEEQMQALTQSSCLYVGNLSFTCRTVHVRDHFEQLGPVKNVIMGLDRNKKTPCGFCFVDYYDRYIALRAVSLLTGSKLDGNIIRVELDAGFQPGREYGRGVHGGQVRDDRRERKRPRVGGLYSQMNNATAEVKLDAALPSARDVASGHYGPTGTDHKSNKNNSGPAAPAKLENKTEEDTTMDHHEEERGRNDDDNDDDEARPGAKRQKTEE
jgi:nuclear cap-binding protein subunit 2